MHIELSEKITRRIKWFSILIGIITLVIFSDIYEPYQRTKVFGNVIAEAAIDIYGPTKNTTKSVKGKRVYTVKKGDTVYDIAQKYHSNKDILATANDLGWKFEIKPGQKLIIPNY